MKYEIDTIPVWDAFKAESECPLCLLERRSRKSAVHYYLGPSVMVPEVRIQANEVGFSAEHLRILSKDPNKLGLALLTHTRMKYLREKLISKQKPLLHEAQKNAGPSGITSAFKSKASLQKAVQELTSFLQEQEQGCLIQKKVDEDLKRYAFTLLHLWKNDHDFRTYFPHSKGFCIPHFRLTLEMASDHWDAPTLGSFICDLLQLMESNWARVEVDVLSFTQTFDGTKSHTIEGQPQGALERGLQKLAGPFKEYEDESKTRKGPLMGS